ncbi:hypothetical protein Plec18167_003260 [Paecilomyces lecythidis]|uniref:NmrA-like domain-containing protein n=1 Tax=Paecilomyces lecythidis TaxID=3004212 RepID=A0ABR3Y173_9EURO
MPAAIKNVAVAGGTGTLGTHVVNALLDSGAFNVTVLTRNSSAKVHPNISVKQVDYRSVESLIDALRGQDAVIDSTYSETDAASPCHLIDASIAAGVYRYIPPEFGSDPLNENVQALPFFQRKATVTRHLFEKVKDTNLTWTAIANGPFFDPPLKDGTLGIDVRKKKATIYGNENCVSPWTTLQAIGKATAQVLLKPGDTENKVVYISNANLSQNDILKLAMEELGENDWEIRSEDIHKSYEEANNKLRQGEIDLGVIFTLLKYSMTSQVYTYVWESNDNNLLGVEQFTDDKVKALIGEIANGSDQAYI